MRLGDHCKKIGSGATPRGGQKVYLDDGPFSLIRSKNVHNHGFEREGLVYISDSHANQLRHVEVLSGDVLLNITGDSVARVCQVPDEVLPARVNQHVAIIRPDPDVIDPRFLRYFLTAPSTQALMLSLAAAGATRNALTKGMIEDIKVPNLPVDEQRAIASVLGALDDKIELNRRMNETLEAMARALFKSWFVDLDPVKAKAQGRQPAHMDPATAALFPDRLDDDGKPAGWRNSTIGDAVKVVGGSTPSTKEPTFWEGGVHHWATPKDLAALPSPVLLDTARKITDAGVKKISSGLLPAGTVLLSSRAPVGYLAISEVPVAVNQGFIAMVCEKDLSNLYVLYWCYENMDAIKRNAGGTTFQEISKRNFRPLQVVVPDPPVLKAFDCLVRPIHLKMVAYLKESQVLAELRDTLLPKLMSGEIRLRDAEKAVEAVA